MDIMYCNVRSTVMTIMWILLLLLSDIEFGIGDREFVEKWEEELLFWEVVIKILVREDEGAKWSGVESETSDVAGEVK